MSFFVGNRERRMRSIEARLDRMEREHEVFAHDIAEAHAALVSARERIEALEAERERLAPCPK